MAEFYTGKKRPNRGRGYLAEAPTPKNKLFHLILKQISACICCGIVILSMNSITNQRLNDYADALGNALRYETDISSIKNIYSNILKWFDERFSNSSDEGVIDTPTITEH